MTDDRAVGYPLRDHARPDRRASDMPRGRPGDGGEPWDELPNDPADDHTMRVWGQSAARLADPDPDRFGEAPVRHRITVEYVAGSGWNGSPPERLPEWGTWIVSCRRCRWEQTAVTPGQVDFAVRRHEGNWRGVSLWGLRARVLRDKALGLVVDAEGAA